MYCLFRYKRLQEMQKSLEQKINGKLSNDIHNIQQTLEYQARRKSKARKNASYSIISYLSEKQLRKRGTIK